MVRILGTLCIGATLIMGCNSVLKDKRFKTVEMSERQEKDLKLKLFPLPHEIRGMKSIYSFNPGNASLIFKGSPAARQEKLMKDLGVWWNGKFKSELNRAKGDPTSDFNIIFMNSSDAKGKDIVSVRELEYLKNRPNPEQAYMIKTIANPGKFNVCLIYNDYAGMYYAMVTCQQLIDAISTQQKLRFSDIMIVDWPDMKWRGTWNVLARYKKDEDIKRIKAYSTWKCNYIMQPRISGVIDKKNELKAEWRYKPELIESAKEYALRLVPGGPHLPALFRWTLGEKLRKAYPECVGVKSAKLHEEYYPICFSSPRSQEFIDKFIISLAKEYGDVSIWLSECSKDLAVCHCSKCKGDAGKCFIAEVKHVVKAYKKAKKINPNFKMDILFTQGSYSHNHKLLELIPKDVSISFYHGQMSYKSYFQVYNLPPSVNAFVHNGYEVASVPMPVASHYGGGLFQYPFQTPEYCKLLCSEALDRGSVCFNAFFPMSVFAHSLNSQACAEFLWNNRGRSAREFVVSWAVRHGLSKPEKVADVVLKLENSERGLSNCYGSNKIVKIIKPIVTYFTGMSKGDKNVYSKLEYATYDELARLRKNCEAGVKEAADIGDPELYAGAKLICDWISILEQYAYSVENPKNLEIKKNACKNVKNLIRKLKKDRKKWFSYQGKYFEKGVLKYYNKNFFEPISKSFDSLLEQKDLQDDTIKKMFDEGKLKTIRLNGQDWKYLHDYSKVGNKKKWFSPEYNAEKWKSIKIGQGWPRNTKGIGWYRLAFKVPEGMMKFKHVMLFFGAVDEDAVIYLNGKKIFAHNYKTIGQTAPASTWDIPFQVDIKPFLKDGENLLAVEVYNRAGQGGIWRDVDMLGCSKILNKNLLLKHFLTQR